LFKELPDASPEPDFAPLAPHKQQFQVVLAVPPDQELQLQRPLPSAPPHRELGRRQDGDG
jgi:hypothetical protein